MYIFKFFFPIFNLFKNKGVGPKYVSYTQKKTEHIYYVYVCVYCEI